MTRVDDGDRVALLDQVPVRVRVLHAVDALGDGAVEHRSEVPGAGARKRATEPERLPARLPADEHRPAEELAAVLEVDAPRALVLLSDLVVLRMAGVRPQPRL